jgi:hypothetical protein
VSVSQSLTFPGGSLTPPVITGAVINYTYFIGTINPVDPQEDMIRKVNYGFDIAAFEYSVNPMLLPNFSLNSH